MPRAFTIDFFFNGINYTAVITQLDNIVTIYLPDEKLHNILPKGKFTFNTCDNLSIEDIEVKPRRELINSILNVLSNREKENSGNRSFNQKLEK